MSQIIFAIAAVYFFVFLGFSSKKILGSKINNDTLVNLTIYFLQPILIFWGISQRPLDMNLITSPLFFFGVLILSLAISIIWSRLMFKDPKTRSVATVTGIIGNTGSLAIPLGAALYGPESIPYTTIINIANSLFFLTFSVFFFSSGSYSIPKSLKNIIKSPLIWAAIIGITTNFLELKISPEINTVLEKGAHTSIVMSLIIFGIYLNQGLKQKANLILTFTTLFQKFILLPSIGLIFLTFIHFDSLTTKVILLQLIVPTAISNINFSALYDCKPKIVTKLTFLTSALSIITIPLTLIIFEKILSN